MRNRFDQFAKQMAGKVLATEGTVRTDEEVSPDAGHIDIWFTPRHAGRSNQNKGENKGEAQGGRALASLGMLGRMARVPFTMEPFHRTPDGREVMAAVSKHHYFRHRLAGHRSTAPAERGSPAMMVQGQFSRSEPPLATAAPRRRGTERARGDHPKVLPVQWIVSSGRPASALRGLRFRRGAVRRWGPGVYDGPPLTHTRLIVVAELAATRDTLLLRLLGAGRCLSRALKEVDALPEDAPERALTYPLLLKLRVEIPKDPAERTESDEEFIMATQDILDAYIEKLKQEGREEGRAEGREEGRAEGRNEGSCLAHRKDLIDVYTTRFGAPPASVAAIIAQTNDPNLLGSWLKLVAGASAKEAAAAIRAARPRVAKPVSG